MLEDRNEDLGWNRLGLHPNEMMEVVTDRDIWQLNLECPRNLHGMSGFQKKKTLHLLWFKDKNIKDIEFTGGDLKKTNNWLHVVSIVSWY